MRLQKLSTALIAGCALAAMVGEPAVAGRGSVRSPVVTPTPVETEPPVVTPPPVVVPPPVFDPSAGFTTIAQADWNQAAVERVLHAFAFGGQATPQQVDAWTKMSPQEAIQEILSVAPTNPRLAPVQDNIPKHLDSLESLQRYLASNAADNPICPSQRGSYSETIDISNGRSIYSISGLSNTWFIASAAGGSNPFLHKMGLWFTNYLMPVIFKNRIIILRQLYNDSIEDFSQGAPLWQILSDGAASAAISHQFNLAGSRFDNNKQEFYGDDNFAREIHQNFFGIYGDTEDADYHENVTIKNTALLLTGMDIDLDNPVMPTYSVVPGDENLLAPIVFTDHRDPSGRNIRNRSMHHTAALEILGESIAGATAKEKLDALSEVAITHPESLDNVPVRIVRYFGDDNLTPEKISVIRRAWESLNGKPGDLLNFLQAYAISTTFHSPDTVKVWNAFDRNGIVKQVSAIDNRDLYVGYTGSFIQAMTDEGADLFGPLHGIFGGQTGIDALNDAGVFLQAYNYAVGEAKGQAAVSLECKDARGRLLWQAGRDRRGSIPSNNGRYRVGDVAAWLWGRLTADGGKNLGVLERAHLAALLARGVDLAGAVDSKKPDAVYTAQQLSAEPLATKIRNLENTNMTLSSSNPAARDKANRAIGLAISFIRATPYAFAMEGR